MQTPAREYVADQRAFECSTLEISTSCWDAATERVLADVDTFADELAATCLKAGRVNSDWETRAPGRLLLADDAVVLHAGLVAGQRGDAETALEALRILGTRHLDRNAAIVARIAAEYAEDA